MIHNWTLGFLVLVQRSAMQKYNGSFRKSPALTFLVLVWLTILIFIVWLDLYARNLYDGSNTNFAKNLQTFQRSTTDGAQQRSDVVVSFFNRSKPACRQWPDTNDPLSPDTARLNILHSPPPRGLVVTLIHKEGYLIKFSCGAIPSQLVYFIEPHEMDLLLLISDMPKVNEYKPLPSLVECLKLEPTNKTKPWENFDGTTLVTEEYTTQSGRSRVFIVNNYTLPLPKYIQNNMTILTVPIEDEQCRGPIEYIQSTRWYTQGMLHLSILQEYQYWVKLDTDILFKKRVPFHLLHDMTIKNALFAHTAAYPGQFCGEGIREAMRQFEMYVKDTAPSWQKEMKWEGMCSPNIKAMQRDADLYYTNFVIGSVKFWTSKPVLDLANFLNEYPNGFFKYRWTDQIFFHFALGNFVGPDFRAFTTQYTDLRCAPVQNCWISYFSDKYSNDTMASWERCDNEAYFLHTKKVGGYHGRWNNRSLIEKPLRRGIYPYISTYNISDESRQCKQAFTPKSQ